ncbi:hypothetical protein Naga_100889g2 [Nannochloropsis gaditana]|uniref:Uncharacterized protein n=1 Tax=Nannochloropsis gaditana TaxID=72520 RepID=W7TT39_9STRA|nr:hypothetical protein Naga_100889g2 [Nannochloropsis gaditana]
MKTSPFTPSHLSQMRHRCEACSNSSLGLHVHQGLQMPLSRLAGTYKGMNGTNYYHCHRLFAIQCLRCHCRNMIDCYGKTTPSSTCRCMKGRNNIAETQFNSDTDR